MSALGSVAECSVCLEDKILVSFNHKTNNHNANKNLDLIHLLCADCLKNLPKPVCCPICREEQGEPVLQNRVSPVTVPATVQIPVPAPIQAPVVAPVIAPVAALAIAPQEAPAAALPLAGIPMDMTDDVPVIHPAGIPMDQTLEPWDVLCDADRDVIIDIL